MGKKRFIITISNFIFYLSLFAHSGRTDSDGGHYNRSTGEYHNHNGSSISSGLIILGIVIAIILINSGRNKRK